MSETFMKERPILPLLASMALPMVLSMLVNSLYNIVDSFFVAKISEEAMTALSLVYPVQNFINAVAIGFGVGINAVIAIGLGAGDRRRADAAAAQGIALSALHGLVLTAACIAIMPSFLARFTSDPAVIQMGLQYSGIAFSFSVIIMLGLSFEKLFQAVGRMKITMAALLAGCENIPITYAGGVGSFRDLENLREAGKNRLDVTVGSALDLFGGSMSFDQILKFCKN